jgi:nucleoid-associated protein YgaU
MTVPVGAPHPTDPAAADVSSDVPSAPAPDALERPRPVSAPEIAAAICPYLSSASGAWRSAATSREHRCTALTPPAPQPADKQRRHCLSADHVDCSIFRAARTARETALAGGADPRRISAADNSRRPLPRTAPVLLEPPRLIDQVTRLQLDRAPGQVALVALMVVAFVVVALSRFSGGSPAASPGPSFVAVGPSLPVETPSPTPFVTPSAGPSGPPSASPGPSFRTSYRVKKGDTLASIAAKYKVTVAAIRAANGLKSNTIHTGQVLKIP